jgi:hypothetical protein
MQAIGNLQCISINMLDYFDKKFLDINSRYFRFLERPIKMTVRGYPGELKK